MARLLPVRRGEWPRVLMSGACFFFLLLGYFLLRPIREAMGVQRSMDELRWLFVTTCAVSLGVTLAFGGMVARMERRRFITIAFRVVMACLAGFIIARLTLGEPWRVASGYVFYVWLSVVNLFMVSVFWGFMADVWSLEQGKRLFAAIGIGGTAGALLGSNFVWWMAARVEAWVQIAAAVVAFEIAVQLVRAIDRTTGGASGRDHPTRAGASSPDARPGGDGGGEGLAGGLAGGLMALARSPYLLGIGLYITLLAVSNTLLYFTQARLVVDASDELGHRIALFAQLDAWTQLATLLAQLFVTARLIRMVGVGITLALLPAVTLGGFAALAWVSGIEGIEGWRVFAVFAVFNALHRATRYAVIRPARETLFSVVPAREKYRAKPIVDVFLYRGGDVAGAGAEKAIAAAGLGLMGIAMVAAPLALLWGGLALALAAAQGRKNEAHDDVQAGLVPGSIHTPPGAVSAGTGATT